MNSQKKPKSLQDRLKHIQRSSFVGREEQVAVFRRNLELPLESDRRRFLFNVWGQGGVGKSTLLSEFRKIGEEAKVVAAYTNEDEKSVPEAMARLAEQLKQQGHKLAQFSDRYEVFRQKRQELEADPEAPQGFSAFLGRTVAKTGVRLARRVPVGGAIFDFVDEDAVTTQAGEWASYVAKKLTNKDEVRLVNEPIAELTPLFLKDLFKVAEKSDVSDVALFFDTYERTEEFLDEWLREILEGHYGDAPANLLLVVAGRQELDKNHWANYEGAIVHLPLEPFTGEEARQYLVRKGVTSDRVIEVILRLSGRLPLLIATLAAEIPDDPSQVGDPSGTAVERFLKWVDDPKRRQVALDAALPQCLNRDVLAQLNGEEEADALFSWLKEMPFVEERTDGWAYHEVVRTQMLRHKRLVSPQSWADLHGKLASYYDTLRNNLQLDEDKQQQDTTWQNHTLNVLYHRLCQAPQQNLNTILNEFFAALKNYRIFALGWGMAVATAGRDAEASEVESLGRQLLKSLLSYEAEHYEDTIKIFKAILKQFDIKNQWKAVALSWIGNSYYLVEDYEEALKNFSSSINYDPENASLFFGRGLSYKAIEEFHKALEDFDKAISIASKNASILTMRGRTYYLLNQHKEAIEDFSEAIELEPEHTVALFFRGTARFIAADAQSVLINFQSSNLNPPLSLLTENENNFIQTNYEEALKDFNKVVELEPDNLAAIVNRGHIYKALEQYQEALRDFDSAINSGQVEPDSLFNRGQVYFHLNCFVKALEDFNQAIEMEPQNYTYICSRAKLYLELKLYKEAIQDFCCVIGFLHQKCLEATRQGVDEFLLEDYKKAIEDLDQAIESSCMAAAAMYSRSKAYRLMENHEETTNNLDEATKFSLWSAFVTDCRGKCYLLLQCIDEAMIDFNSAIEIEAKDWYLYDRALAYKSLDQLDKAQADLNLAIHTAQEAYKENLKDWCCNTFNLAIYHLAAGNIEESKRFYRDAFSRGASVQDIKEAVLDLDHFLTIFPEHQQARAVRQAIEKELQKRSLPS